MRQKIICIIILLTFILANQRLKAQIIINEILAANTSSNIDRYTKNFIDWIELYNTSGKKLNIGGWYLTDNIDKPTKWKIPYYISINAHDYELFYADKKNIRNHTNFKLNMGGESVYLFNKDSILVDSVFFPKQAANISYGRIYGDIEQWRYFHEPSPQKTNPISGIEKLDFASKPVFSEKAGFYKKPFKLKLSVLQNTAKIHYTIDGSSPTQASAEYSKPIIIAKNTVIRSRTYTNGKLPSKVATQSYFIKETFRLPVVSLSFDPKHFWDKDIGIYVNGANYIVDNWESANYFKQWERPVNIEYFDMDGKNGFNLRAGVRIHGRSTRNFAQKTLAVLTRNKYDKNVINDNLFGKNPTTEIKTFLLRNSGNDWGATMFLDGLIHTLVNNKIDIDAQAYQPSVVFLNGQYWGIHNIREKINEHYIKSKYHIKTKNIDIIEADTRNGKLVASFGNMVEYDKMIVFIKNNSLSEKKNFEHIKKQIDIDECINYLITQVYIGNNDWPGSNTKFWKERGDSGKWRWILYDTEYSFDNYEVNKTDLMLTENSKEIINPPWSNYLFRRLFGNEEFKLEFVQRMAVYLNTVFETGQVLHVIDSLKENIKPEVKRNLKKWGGIKQNAIPYLITSKSVNEWEANIKFIISFAKNRPGIVRKNIMQYFAIKDTLNLKLRINDKNAGKIKIMGHTLNEGKFDGNVFVAVPIRLEAIANKGYKFVKWKEANYKNECVISLNQNKKLTAIFQKIE